MEPNFDLEEITLTGKGFLIKFNFFFIDLIFPALRAIMQKTAQFGVNNYLSLNKDCHER